MGENSLNACAHSSGKDGLTYMPVPSSNPARLLIRGTIEIYQWKCLAGAMIFSAVGLLRHYKMRAEIGEL